MYPNVTQFETRDRLIRDEIRLRAQREAHTRRARTPDQTTLTRRILNRLRFA